MQARASFVRPAAKNSLARAKAALISGSDCRSSAALPPDEDGGAAVGARLPQPDTASSSAAGSARQTRRQTGNPLMRQTSRTFLKTVNSLELHASGCKPFQPKGKAAGKGKADTKKRKKTGRIRRMPLHAARREENLPSRASSPFFFFVSRSAVVAPGPFCIFVLVPNRRFRYKLHLFRSAPGRVGGVAQKRTTRGFSRAAGKAD